MIDYGNFSSALCRLEEQHRNWRTLDVSRPRLEQEAVLESVVKRFEICYDSLWKVLKRFLVERLGIVDAPNSPNGVFRLAAENDLFASPVEQWLLYTERRIGTTHDYSGEKAEACREVVDDFLADARDLLRRMTGSG